MSYNVCKYCKDYNESSATESEKVTKKLCESFHSDPLTKEEMGKLKEVHKQAIKEIEAKKDRLSKMPVCFKNYIYNHIVKLEEEVHKLEEEAHFFKCILENRILDSSPYLPDHMNTNNLFHLLMHHYNDHDNKKCG